MRFKEEEMTTGEERTISVMDLSQMTSIRKEDVISTLQVCHSLPFVCRSESQTIKRLEGDK